MKREGDCLCGAVRYVVRGPLREVLVRHCCRGVRWPRDSEVPCLLLAVSAADVEFAREPEEP